MATGGLTADDLTNAFKATLRTILPTINPPPTEPASAPTAPTATSRFKAVELPVEDQGPQPISKPNWKRVSLKPVDLHKLRINATKDLTNKFSLMSIIAIFLTSSVPEFIRVFPPLRIFILLVASLVAWFTMFQPWLKSRNLHM